jgi:hypothetical protein
MPDPTATAWKTMDSAPRDGSDVLLWVPRCANAPHGTHCIARWHMGEWYQPFFAEPTHWQPLPPPPGEGE